MSKLWLNVMLVIGMMSATACAIEESPEEPAESEAVSALTDFEQPLLVFEKKPFWSSWNNFCEALDGMEIRTTISGCTTAQTYTNCRAGAISGTCKCDVSTSRSGTCD